MVILSKLADYAVIVATHLASAGAGPWTAVEIAASTRLPATTVAKVLKSLARGGIVTAHRGAQGGYRLARPAAAITVAALIEAIDGRVALTECTSHAGPCERDAYCATRPHWHRINQAVATALAAISLAEMAPRPLGPLFDFPPDARADRQPQETPAP